MHGLLTDRHSLAMLGESLREGMAERRAVFELSVAKLPAQRRFLLVAGIDRVVRYLMALRFTNDEIEYLRTAQGLTAGASEAMVTYLRAFRFRGDIDAMAEGDVAFAGEPLLRVEGSLAEGQIIEMFLLGVINAETRVASKAARVVLAADGRPVYELGARCADPLGAPWASRAAWIAGCAGTSCEEAGLRFGVPIADTAVHRDDQVITSDDLDEHGIRALVCTGAGCKAFGVGAAMVLTPDAPSLGAVYNLVEIDDRQGARVSVGMPSPGGLSLGGTKQVFRVRDGDGRLLEDFIGRAEESLGGERVLVPVMRRGKLVQDLPDPRTAAARARERATRSVASLPSAQREIADAVGCVDYPVGWSDALRAGARTQDER